MPDTPIQAAVHGPYEDAIIEGFRLLEKIVDGQTPEVKARLWDAFITVFVNPIVAISKTIQSIGH